MKDDSGHFGDTPTISSPYAGRPVTQEEADALAERLKDASVASPVQYLSPELQSGPSGWYTIPKPIRFVVWVWAIFAIVGMISVAVWALVLLIGGGIALSQM